MRFSTVFFLALLLLLSNSLFGQSTAIVPDAPAKYAPISSEDILVAVLSQPDSPIQLANARILLNLSRNRIEYFWDARNNGPKAITRYMTEEWWVDGTGGSMTSDSLLRPLRKGAIHQETVPRRQLTILLPERREKLMKEPYTPRLVVLVVKEVGFADGTYKIFNVADALQKYLSAIGNCKMFN